MTLFGYGKTTSAIAKKFGNCDIYDDKFTQIEEFGTNRLIPMGEFDPEKSTLEVVSPGIAPDHKQVATARNLISEYDLFADQMPFSIWISGTNGKTTVTKMLLHLLAKRGAVMGGNVGTPLADLDTDAPIWILETSSFTLHYTQKAKPNIYLLLPISDDHASWHGSFEAYENAKLKPFEKMQEGEMIIAPQKYRDTATDGFFVGYENEKDLAQIFEIDLAKIRFERPFLIDAVFALAVTKTLFNEIDYELINTYIVEPHKLEKFADKQNRVWIDDSKATNIDATMEAIKSYENHKIHLILGGDDKGADLAPLFDLIRGKNITIYAIGSNANKLISLAEESNIDAVLCGFLEIAVDKIDKLHDQSSVAMLSPAAASLDQFLSYIDRGEKFKEFIAKL